MYNFLRRFRIIISLAFFLVILFCFINSYHWVGRWWTLPLAWQLIPAILAGSLTVVILLTVLTLFFGRIYCSTLCPLGTYQDIVRRIAHLFKSKKARRMNYCRPHNSIRYGILALTIITFILGSSVLLLWLDPYGNFGRIATNIVSPVCIFLGNSLSEIIGDIPAHNYRTFTISASIAAMIILLLITTLSAWRGRLYCNLICPVGSLLGLISEYAFFKLQLDPERCTRCSLCSKQCKAQCIDVVTQRIDNTRCVQCYDCTISCNVDAITYKKNNRYTITKQAAASNTDRRFFLGALGGIIAAGVTRSIVPPFRKISGNSKALTPPGSQSQEEFKAHCTACHACIGNCPSHVLRPAIDEYGIDGFLMPVLDYNRSFCNYECTVCSEICPNNAIKKITKEEKVIIQIGKAKFMPGRCIVVRDETDCGACDEHCPANAIEMVNYGEGLLIPKVNPDICIGCGGCEYICPARPNKAIFVVANEIHQIAAIYQEEETQEHKVDDFGF